MKNIIAGSVKLWLVINSISFMVGLGCGNCLYDIYPHGIIYGDILLPGLHSGMWFGRNVVMKPIFKDDEK